MLRQQGPWGDNNVSYYQQLLAQPHVPEKRGQESHFTEPDSNSSSTPSISFPGLLPGPEVDYYCASYARWGGGSFPELPNEEKVRPKPPWAGTAPLLCPVLCQSPWHATSCTFKTEEMWPFLAYHVAKWKHQLKEPPGQEAVSSLWSVCSDTCLICSNGWDSAGLSLENPPLATHPSWDRCHLSRCAGLPSLPSSKERPGEGGSWPYLCVA